MKKWILGLVCLVLTIPSFALEQTVLSVERAKKEKLISYRGIVDFRSGRRKLKLKIKNLSNTNISILIETGRIFYPLAVKYQPLVVTRGKTAVFAPKEEREVYVNAICGNAPLSAASNGSTEFNSSNMGDEKLVKVLNYLVEKELDTRAPIQNIIWHFTNHHQIAGIWKAELTKREYSEMMNFISGVSNQSIPWYTVEYKEENPLSEQLFTGRADKVEGDIFYTLASETDVIIRLRSEKGTEIKTISYINRQPPGDYNYPFRLDANLLETGKYFVSFESPEGTNIRRFEFAI
jgi:hypothetical protein